LAEKENISLHYASGLKQ